MIFLSLNRLRRTARDLKSVSLSTFISWALPFKASVQANATFLALTSGGGDQCQWKKAYCFAGVGYDSDRGTWTMAAK
jgi:hypothetical protein